MNASNLLQSVLKPRNSTSRPLSSPKKNRKILNKSFTASENVVPTGRSILKPASPQICLCSPTNHPGSFRCRLHRALKAPPGSSPITTAKVGQSKHVLSAEASIKSNPSTPPPNHETRSRFERRPSRLSKVVMATDPEMGVVTSIQKVTCTLVSEK